MDAGGVIARGLANILRQLCGLDLHKVMIQHQERLQYWWGQFGFLLGVRVGRVNSIAELLRSSAVCVKRTSRFARLPMVAQRGSSRTQRSWHHHGLGFQTPDDDREPAVVGIAGKPGAWNRTVFIWP